MAIKVDHQLSELASVLRARFGVAPTYRRLWDLITSGVVPARKDRSGRWRVLDKDLPAVAAALRASARSDHIPPAA